MFIRSLKLQNILSFRELQPFKLDQLNILIGPNGSGKSNFLDCFDLFRSLPSDLNGFLVHHGGPEGWIWKGKATGESVARLECEFELGKQGLEYGIAFDTGAGVLVIQREWLAPANRSKNAKREPKRHGPFLDRFAGKIGIRGRAAGNGSSIARTESVLTAYRDPLDKTQITPTARAFSDIRVYRSFDTSPDGSLRTGVSAASPKYPLESDGYNLALVLQQMDFHGSLPRVGQYLNQFSGRFREIKINLEGGRAQLYLEERAVGKVSATRLSDGTLKFLCLIALLFDHDPPRLLCIDEPESGLHPDAIKLVADALREASSRMQIVVTTHSDALIDWFTDQPESVVVCERDFDEGTRLSRLSRARLKEWLKNYTLGDLWRRGELGGKQR
jgi:predicted ATPase